MTARTIALGCLTAALLALPAAAPAQSSLDIPWLRLGAGVTLSDDLDDMTGDYGLDVSGDWGWLDLNAGLEFPLTDTISIIPYASFYFNRITGDDDSFNMILVPSLAAKFLMGHFSSMTDYWYPDADFDTYVQAEINYPIPFDGSDEFDMDSGGFGFAILLGLQLDYGYDLGIGYSYLPIEDDYESDRNMGGLLVRLNKSF